MTRSRHIYSPKHGKSDTPEYYCWRAMKQRCYATYNSEYKNYGGRGIAVCERWRRDFNLFLADMGQRPSPEHSIERVDNDGNYEPTNCKWATKQEQSANRRMNRFLTFQGRTLTMSEWSRELPITYNAIRARVRKGWPVDKTLTTPQLGKDRKPISV